MLPAAFPDELEENLSVAVAEFSEGEDMTVERGEDSSDDDDEDGDEEDEDGDEEDANDAADLHELEFAWEPLPEDPEVLPEDPLFQENPSSPVQADVYLPPTQVQEGPPSTVQPFLAQVYANQEHLLHNNNVRIEKFPGEKAGTPVLDRDQHLYVKYQEHLGDGTNPYAPFSSKLDWEFAQWAKLRGPGSTAITELLKIDGVCLFIHIKMIIIISK